MAETPPYRVVRVMDEDNSIILVLFNLRNLSHFLFERYYESDESARDSDYRRFVLRAIRQLEGHLFRLNVWYQQTRPSDAQE